LLQWPCRVFLHGHEISEDLRRMELVRQPVIDGDARPLRKNLDLLLRKAAILYGVIQPAQHARSVFHRLLLADLRSGWAEIGDMRALVMGRDLETGTGARRVLLEDQRDVAALQPLYLLASAFCLLEACG